MAALLIITPAAAEGGKLKIDCNVKAKVYLNGIFVGETGTTISGLPTGEVRLKVEAEGFESAHGKVTIWGNELAAFVVELMKKGEGESTIAEKAAVKAAPPPVREKEEAKKPEKKKEEAKKKESSGKSYSEEDVEKASKEKNIALLKEMLKNASEYKIKLMAASALHRLKVEEGTDWIDAQVADDFRQAGKDFFEDCPLVEGSRKAIESRRLVEVIKTKHAKIDTFEEVVAGYLVLLQLEKRRQETVIEKENAEEKMEDRGRGRGRRGFRRANREKDALEDMDEEIKLNQELMKAVISLLKKASSNKNKDMGALAKHLAKHAEDRISTGK
jgi:hypothetical protein